MRMKAGTGTVALTVKGNRKLITASYPHDEATDAGAAGEAVPSVNTFQLLGEAP
jgi:hypothetical protein